MSTNALTPGRGAGNRQMGATTAPGAASHAVGSALPVQSGHFVAPHFPFQPLPTPNGPAPYRFDISQLLSADAVGQIAKSGKLAFHTTGDTGDERGKQMDFVAAMMTQDYGVSPAPAFYYHLGDVVYFAGDVDKYGSCFYETYAEYPGPIVAIAGNHDCQPDDPQDGPVDPNKKPLDGWLQNFMSTDPTRIGSLKTTSSRTQMDLPNVFWTFTMPFATIIGLFSNVSESEAQLHQDQIDWFNGELKAAAPDKALIVAIHHPPFSGDDEHSGSGAAEKVLFDSFKATGVYPHLILSGHVHNYQRFTAMETAAGGSVDVTCVVIGNGGYSRLGRLHKLNGQYPTAPLKLTDSLTLENYDQDNFGFLRIEVTAQAIAGIYSSAPFQETADATGTPRDKFVIDVKKHTVKTV